MHKLWVVGGDRVDFLLLSAPTASVFSLACEDDVGGMLVRELVVDGSDHWPGGRLLRCRRRLTSRRRRHQSLAFGDSREPMTLPSRMVGRLRAAVELAGGIKGLLVGESRLPSRPAALLLLGHGPPFRLFVFDCGYLPTGGRRHRGLALVVAWVRASIGVTGWRLGSQSEHLSRGIHSKLSLH